MIPEHSLREIRVLSGLPASELEGLGVILRERRAPKGSYLVFEEDPGPNMMFMAEGSAKVTLVSDEGKECVIANLVKGDFFGELAVLTGEDRSANVVAQTDCRFFILTEEDFKRQILHSPEFALALMKELALRLRRATAKIGDLALYDVYRRVARTLKSMAKRKEIDGVSVYVLEERPTHQELASMVGTSREMITRALKGLEEDGCITIDGRRISVFKMPI